MGYWEQIAENNLHLRQRRTQMHPMKRRLLDSAKGVCIAAITLVLWALLLAPYWQMLAR